MGFYLRKSISVGGVRFNLSKSGIGMSAGIRGFRIGSGPRGAYVHAGTNGFYYRQSLPTGSGRTANHGQAVRPTPSPVASGAQDLTEIDSGDVLQMTDTSAEALLSEINEKLRKPQFVGWGVLFALIATVALGLTGLGIGFLSIWALAQWDRIRRTTVLLYEMEEPAKYRYQLLHDAFDEFGRCGGHWHMEAQGSTQDRKRHAGANTLIRRKKVTLAKQPPSTLKTNIDVPTLPAGRQSLCFLPDRLLVFDKGSVGAVSYEALTIEASDTRFIETEAVPADAQVVGHTWRYVNKNGGPDKRFKDNRQIPICKYEEIWFRSATGLQEAYQVSRPMIGALLREAIRGQVQPAATT